MRLPKIPTGTYLYPLIILMREVFMFASIKFRKYTMYLIIVKN